MLSINPVPAFQDNYFWVFHTSGNTGAWVVDPGDAKPVKDYLEKHDLTLDGIVITHHHTDHTGGISALLEDYAVPVTGPDSARIREITDKVSEHMHASFSDTEFEVLEIPGHTLDHIAYFSPNGGEPVLFCGDTLFAGGCGRVFEGTGEMMYASLQKLAALPKDTRVFCAHEYTLSNLKFALAVLPECEFTLKRMEEEARKREQGLPTVPTTIARELCSNIFLRSHEDMVKMAVENYCGRALDSPADVFTELRRWKDQF